MKVFINHSLPVVITGMEEKEWEVIKKISPFKVEEILPYEDIYEYYENIHEEEKENPGMVEYKEFNEISKEEFYVRYEKKQEEYLTSLKLRYQREGVEEERKYQKEYEVKLTKEQKLRSAFGTYKVDYTLIDLSNLDLSNCIIKLRNTKCKVLFAENLEVEEQIKITNYKCDLVDVSKGKRCHFIKSDRVILKENN